MFEFMRKSGQWAATHKWAARSLIFACYLLLFIINYLGGRILNSMAVVLPMSLCYISIALTGLIYLIHEFVHKRVYIRNWYVFHKSCAMLVLMISTFGLLVACTQPQGTLPVIENKAMAAFPVVSGNVATKVLIKPFKKSNDVGKMPLGVKIALIVGIVVACAFLEYGILIVSCMIDCSGYGFLALIFVVGGTTGVIFLCAHLIRTVLGRTRRQRFGKKDWGDNAQYSF